MMRLRTDVISVVLECCAVAAVALLPSITTHCHPRGAGASSSCRAHVAPRGIPPRLLLRTPRLCAMQPVCPLDVSGQSGLFPGGRPTDAARTLGHWLLVSVVCQHLRAFARMAKPSAPGAPDVLLPGGRDATRWVVALVVAVQAVTLASPNQ